MVQNELREIKLKEDVENPKLFLWYKILDFPSNGKGERENKDEKYFMETEKRIDEAEFIFIYFLSKSIYLFLLFIITPKFGMVIYSYRFETYTRGWS
jgi:hypothetical protein